MAKKLFFLIFLLAWFGHQSWAAVRPTVTKTTSATYSGLSGRRYVVPKPYVTHEPMVVAAPPTTHAEELALAQEKNRRTRLWQLQRTSRRPYGAYKYYSNTSTNPPIGTTIDTMPLR